MKRNIIAAALLLTSAASLAKVQTGPGDYMNHPTMDDRGTPSRPFSDARPPEKTRETPGRDEDSTPPARGMDNNRSGDASGYQSTTQQPLTGPGADPETGKQPERNFNGLRFGTSIDDEQRLGPRAR